MLNLLKCTEINKRITKKSMYSKFKMSTSEQNKMNEDVSGIKIVNEITSSKIGIKNGKKIKLFYVVLVSLKKKDFDESNIMTILKFVPKNIVLILECGNEAKLAIYDKHLIYTKWCLKDQLFLELKGDNLDEVWENTIDQILELNVDKDKIENKEIIVDVEKDNLNENIKNKDIILDSKSEFSKDFTNKKNGQTLTEVKSKTMKALSIMPEFAHEILIGEKIVEYRTWKTDYRGDLLICASSRKCKGTVSRHAVCVAKLVDIHIDGYWEGKPEYGWDLEDIRLIKPFPVKGKLHIYEVDASLVEILASID